MTGYGDDLAFIHDAGFGGHARAAVGVLLGAMKVREGRVVDLACGSGILSELVSEAGYDVLGMDLSPAMLELARRQAPKASFVSGSLLSAELPECVAVAIVGEGVNYLFDDSHSTPRLRLLFERIHAALRPGGVLLFDSAGPGRAAARNYREGADWAVLFEAEEDAEQSVLTRRITSFRRAGELYRREYEEHRLRLYAPDDLASPLSEIGFEVQVSASYGDYQFPRGLHAFLCRKGER